MSVVRKFDDESVNLSTPERNGPPPLKKKLVYEPIRLTAVSTLEELDVEVLRFQHRKLKQRLEQRQRNEQNLLERIEQLEKRQTTDDAVLNVTNRYWNQFNEDVRILLQRFDKETLDETESENENEYTTSFLTQLATWDKDELDEKLANRVQVSTRAVARVIQAFDRLQQRNAAITVALSSEGMSERLDDVIKQRNVELEDENTRLQAINTKLHEQHRIMSLKMKQMEEKLNSEETKADEYKNQVDDLSWEVTKLMSTQDKLESHIHDLNDKNKRLHQICETENKREGDLPVVNNLSVTDDEVLSLRKENEELRELATNRLTELERLHCTQKDTLEELERLKMDFKTLPDTVIMATVEYKSLQSKFSVVYNDSLTLRQTLEDTRNQLTSIRSSYVKTTEQLESEELLVQKKLRTEAIQLEDMLSQVRKEYEMLRIEFEQNIAANEQTGPINREMRHLITSLQNHNTQLKGDAQRYRRKYKEIFNEITKVKKEKDDLELRFHSMRLRHQDSDSVDADSGVDGYREDDDSPSSSNRVDTTSPNRNHDGESSNDALHMNDTNRRAATSRQADQSADVIKDLKAQLKQALLSQKETKLLLDMYKGVSKEQRDKVQMMAAEKKVRLELEESKLQIKRYQEIQKEERMKLADDEAIRKIKLLDDQVHGLQRQIATQNSEGETLISEMEVTGQAFEDMQEQNSRLIQQLKEKDDANFKLMSDKIKSNQLQKLAREERELLKEQLKTLTRQVEAQNQVVRRLEEKERILLNTMALQDKEAMLRAQSAELSRRKAIEAAQTAADLKLHLDKYHSQMKDAQQTVAEKTSALEAEAFKARRFQEQIASLNRKVERLNKIEMAGNSDEVMLEEIREYKESLTCPSCKVKRKDAVLTKCFHVFCFDCLRTRYETRQRKCPKCNAGFGANDYHRLYLT